MEERERMEEREPEFKSKCEDEWKSVKLCGRASVGVNGSEARMEERA